MSRTTDFGDSASSATHGWLWRYISNVCLEQLLQRLGPADVLEQLHPLVVLDALGLHLGHGLAAGLVLLRAEHRPRVLQRRLDAPRRRRGRTSGPPGRARRTPPSANVDSGWFSAKSICRSTVSRTVRPSSSGGSSRSTTPAASSAAVHVDRPAHQPDLGARLLVVVAQQRAHRRERVAVAGDDVEQHRVADPHPRDQRLGLGRHQPVEGLLAPGDRALRRPSCAAPCAASWGRRRPWPAPARSR